MAKDIRIIPASGEIKVTGSADFTGDGGSSVLFVSGSGNVGIGTTSPTYKLEVDGDISTNGTEQYLRFNKGNDGYIGSNTANEILLRIRDNQAFRILGNSGTELARFDAATGDFGIGETSPTSRLHVTDATNISMDASGNGQMRVEGLGYSLGFALNSDAAFIYGNSSARDLAFGTDETERMRILGNNGNVGIGTTSPSTKLDVNGVITATGGTSTQWNTAYTYSQVGHLPLTGGTLTGGLTGTTANFTTSITIGNPATNYDDVILKSDLSNKPTGYEGYLVIEPVTRPGSGEAQHLTHFATNASTGTTRHDVQVDGNVGIGTATPSEKLEVAGNVYISGSGSDTGHIYFKRYNTTADVGGIGWHTDNVFYIGGHPSYGPTGGNIVRVYGFGSDIRLGDSVNGDVLTVSQDTGNVGIGTTSPGYLLDVAGAGNFTGGLTGTTANFTTIDYDLLNGPNTSSRDKIRVYNSSTYTIGMQSGVTYGHLSDWAMTFQMNNEADRGFWWGDSTHTTSQGAMALTTEGKLTVATSISVGQGETITSPSNETLYVNGNSTINGDLTVTGKVTAEEFHTEFVSASIIYQSGSTKFGDTSDDVHSFTGSLDVKGTISTNDELIVDDGTRGARLVVDAGSSGNRAALFLDVDSTDGIGVGSDYFNIAQDGVNTSILSIPGTSTGGLYFRKGSTELMYIQHSGNVGIGNTNPAYKLVVDSAATNDGIVVISPNPSLWLKDDTDSNKNWRIYNQGFDDGLSIISVEDDLTSGNTRMFFEHSTGNVGIGTVTPSQKLEVAGNISASNDIYVGNDIISTGEMYIKTGTNLRTRGNVITFSNAAGSSEYARFDSSGRLGIGTTSPSSPLHIESSTNRTITLDFTGGTGGYTWASFKQSGTEQFRIWGNSSSNYLSFYNDQQSSHQLTLASNGNVGIGTTSPDYTLNVIGTVGISEYLYHDNDVNTYLRFATDYAQLVAGGRNIIKLGEGADPDIIELGDSATYTTTLGRVGIGTTAPDAKLHVSGSSDVLLVEGSGSTANTTLLAVDGNNGRLFEVSDDLSDSLFSVNTIAGLPVFEVFADNTIVAGAFNQNDFVISGSRVGIGTASPSQKLEVIGADVSGPSITWKQTNRRSGYLYSDSAGVGIYDTALNNAGIYLANNSRMDFRVNGSERMRITSTGNVGIGTTSPSEKFVVNGPILWQGALVASQTNSGVLDRSGNDLRIRAYGATAGSGNLVFRTGGGDDETDSEAMRITGEGDVGIGTASPSVKLQVVDSNDITLEVTRNTNNNSGIKFSNAGSNSSRLYGGSDSYALRYFYNTSEYVTIATNGNVGIGTTSPSTLLHLGKESDGVNIITMGAASTGGPHGIDFIGNDATETRKYSIYYRTSPAAISFENDSSVTRFEIDQAGDTQISGSLSVGNISPSTTLGRIDASNDVVAYSTSDFQLKENITPITNALDKIAQIEGVEFDWKEISDEERKYVHGNHGHDIGVIAQEIEKILPEAVQTRENGYKAVDYKKIIPLLIEAIKELNHKVDSQEERLSRLEKLL